MTQASQTTAAGGAHYEAGLLARIASAPTQREQFTLAAELETFRRNRAVEGRRTAELDWSIPGLERLQSTAATEPWAPTTTDSDWLAEVEPDAHDLGQVTQAMVAQASTWYSRELHPAVKDYPGEVMAQADGRAGRAAGPYGTAYPVAHRAFMDHVAHLVGRTADQVPPSSTLPVGVSNDATFDTLTWDGATERPKADGTSPSDTPSLGEGSRPAGDVSQGIENPIGEVGHDAGPQGLQHSVDYLDGTRTAPTNGAGSTTMNTVSSYGLTARAASYLGSLAPMTAAPMPMDLTGGAPGLPPVPSDAAAPEGEQVPCPQCLGEGAGSEGQPCELCGGAGQVPPEVAEEFEAQQAPPAAPAVPGPPQPVARRQAHRRVADSVPPLSSDRGGLAESLDEGTEPEGDHPATGEDLVTPVSHDAGPGNGEAVDYLDESTYAWPGATATLRHASPMLPGALPGAAMPPMGAPAAVMPVQAPSWEAQYVASLDPTSLSVVRQALHQTGGGDTPLAAALHEAIQLQQNATPAGAPLDPATMGVAAARLARFRGAVASRVADADEDEDSDSDEMDELRATAAQINALAGYTQD